MSKEQLEEIQREVNYAYRRDGSISTKAVTMPIEHYEHFYERALKNADDLHVMDLQLASEQKEIKKLQDENETLSAANNDLLHEIRVLKNQMNDQTSLRVLEFKVQNKQLLKQNKRYRERLEYMLEEAKDHKKKGLRIQHWALIEDLEKTLESESDE